MRSTHYELVQLLKDCSITFRVPIFMFNHNEKMIHHFPDTVHKPPKIFQKKLYSCLRESKHFPFQLQLFEDIYFQYFFIYPIQNNLGQFTFISMGPYLLQEVEKLKIRKMLILNGMDFSYEDETVKYFSTLTIVNRQKLESTERLLTSLLPGRTESHSIGQIPSEEILDYRNFKSNHLNAKYSQHLLELNENFNRYFKEGNIKALHEYQQLRKSALFPLGNGDELRSAKNNIITLVSKLTRIAIEEGIAKGEAFSLHDFYINYLESKETLTELIKLESTIVQSYLKVMKQRNQSSHISPLVQRAKSFIYNHLTEEINLKSIADELKVNPNYLSSVFNKDTGTSITKYINEQRMKEAKELLSNTPYTLMEISILLGYNSQSYFTRVFKKQEGISPKEFRQKLQTYS
ncbi:helix-turn-helix domain-containing protein [Halobacillus campisalis]|uniref:Helix-turn-helix domain-containing protein n=1 Tax=Halobacillus campisalis TaxID=435909 RepID=A0ABW2K4S9_9BACI|nr:helix-turn-helix domain-containing protein [Halobacillus campisalis]